MELLTDLSTGFDFFTEQAQAICTAAGLSLRANATASKSMAGPSNAPSYAITVFDISTAHYGKECGDIVHQTSYTCASPTAALEALARFYNLPYPLPPAEYLDRDQVEEIVRLLNNPKITRPEKTQVLLKYKRFSPDRATRCIARLRQTIADRENARLDQRPEDLRREQVAVAA